VNTVGIRAVPSADLQAADLDALRELLGAAFKEPGLDLNDAAWANTFGGVHVLLDVDGLLVAHAAIVERLLVAGDRPLRTGYVEAVATRPDRQRSGFGSIVMREVNDRIAAGFELGGLATGSHGFYERLGWQRWRGPTFVQAPDGRRATPEEDASVMVLPLPATGRLDLHGPITCDWRGTEVW